MSDTLKEPRDAVCKNCPYWVKQIDPNDVTAEQGECRANPPQMIAAQIQTQQGLGLSIQSLFPRTGPKGWCAQHPTYQVESRIQEAVEVTEVMAELAAQQMGAYDAEIPAGMGMEESPEEPPTQWAEESDADFKKRLAAHKKAVKESKKA